MIRCQMLMSLPDRYVCPQFDAIFECFASFAYLKCERMRFVQGVGVSKFCPKLQAVILRAAAQVSHRTRSR